MKFRRNVKEEKTFKFIAIFFLIIFIVLLVIYLFTDDTVISIRFGSLSALIIPLCFYISHILKHSFIEFKTDKIILINHKSNNIVIELLNEIEIRKVRSLGIRLNDLTVEDIRELTVFDCNLTTKRIMNKSTQKNNITNEQKLTVVKSFAEKFNNLQFMDVVYKDFVEKDFMYRAYKNIGYNVVDN